MTPALIERDKEVSELDTAVGRSARGDGTLVLTEGPAGVGKTRLLGCCVDMARSYGFHVLTGRGQEVERDLAFGVVRQLLERELRAADRQVREELMAGAAALSVPVFSGELLAAAPAQPDPAYGLLHGVYWLLANMAARKPLAIIVDDVHWCDIASLRALAYVGRRLDGLRVLVVLAARPTRDDPEVGRALSDLRAQPGVVRLTPAVLSSAGTAQLVDRCSSGAVDATAAVKVHETTGGNPFLVVELVQTLERAAQPISIETVTRLGQYASESLASTIIARIRGLGPDASALAWAVAVLGEDADLAEAGALSGLARPAAVAAAASLVTAHVLADRVPLGFVHPLVRAAVYRNRAEVERALAHERAAALLDSIGADQGRILPHLLLSRPAGRADVAERLRCAGRDALAKGDSATGVRFLRRALSEPPGPEAQGEVLFDLALAELAADEASSAADHLRAALALVSGPSRRVEVLLALAKALVVVEGHESAIEVFQIPVADLDAELSLRIDVERTSLALYVTDQAAEALAHMKDWAQLRGVSPAERLALATAALARGFDPTATLTDALPLARRALAEGRLLAEQTADAPPFGNACYVLLFAEDFDELDRELEMAVADARSRGSTFGFMATSLGTTMAALQRGFLTTAIAHGEAALAMWPDLHRTLVAERWCSTALRCVVEALVERGDVARARELVGEWVGVGDIDSAELGMVRVARGFLARADADHEGAFADFCAYGEISRRAGYEDRTTPWRLLAAEAAAALGRRQEAIDLADEAVEIARTWGAPGGLGGALRVRALVGDPLEAHDRLDEAVGTLERSLHRLELVKANYAVGVALLRCGRRTEGRKALKRALEGAARLGAAPLAQRAHRELLVSGARPRRLVFSGVDSLTPSERRIAQMAAAGWTNRRIAQDLFVTQKTVESHLSNVYRKLDVNSRERLATVLRDVDDQALRGAKFV